MTPHPTSRRRRAPGAPSGLRIVPRIVLALLLLAPGAAAEPGGAEDACPYAGYQDEFPHVYVQPECIGGPVPVPRPVMELIWLVEDILDI